MTPIITLTTDYGLADSFVGALKGVLLSRCPGADIVDISHQVPPQAVRIGALRLAAAAPYFPLGTVHLAVVDPGVGGPRRAIAVASGGHFFVGPDNGLLALAAAPYTPDWHAVELTNQDRWLPRVSDTFHGRDIFAPAAAHLAAGGRLDELGPPISTIIELDLPQPVREGYCLRGVVLDVDRFGNLTTNIRREHLADVEVEAVEVGGARIPGLSAWYEPSRPLVALFNGEDRLEIAAPAGNAAAELGLGVAAAVTVFLLSSPPANL